MADMANILLKDDQATPAVHTLVPVVNGPKLVWREDLSTVPVDGQVRLTADWEKLKDGTHRLTLKLEVPTLETIGASSASGYVAAPKVAYVSVAIFTMFAPARSTNADRANLVKMMAHAISGASTTDTSISPNTGTGGTWVTATGPVPYGFIHLALPN